MGWDKALVDIEVIFRNDQAVNIIIKAYKRQCWMLTVVYASHNPIFQGEL